MIDPKIVTTITTKATSTPESLFLRAVSRDISTAIAQCKEYPYWMTKQLLNKAIWKLRYTSPEWPKMLDALIAAGASIHARRGLRGSTILRQAVMFESYSVVQELERHGAIHFPLAGLSSLDEAAAMGQLDTLKGLYHSIKVIGRHSAAPICQAAIYEELKVVQWLVKTHGLSVTKQYLVKGASERESSLVSPLEIAFENDYEEMATWMIQHGGIRNFRQRLPISNESLYEAARARGWSELARWMDSNHRLQHKKKK